MVQDQVKLPLRIAVDVALQGIRIRFGRSVITILGVMLGIAFLMSALTGQLVKQAVRDEEALRTEVKRMASFLAAEMGPVTGKTIGVVQLGPLNETERRFLLRLSKGEPEKVLWHGVVEGVTLPRLVNAEVEEVPLAEVGRNASGVIAMGAESWPAGLADVEGFAAAFDGERGPVLAAARPGLGGAEVGAASAVGLTRSPRETEQAALEAEKRRARMRTAWILTISLIVTVVGIANAMLMSVTERFREIGAMKCLGALSSFISQVFLVESGLVGIVGGVAGALLGAFFTIAMYAVPYGFGLVATSLDFTRLVVLLGVAAAAGVVLSMVAALYPARVASKMAPADALRTDI